jgi:hypothetical protein
MPKATRTTNIRPQATNARLRALHASCDVTKKNMRPKKESYSERRPEAINALLRTLYSERRPEAINALLRTLPRILRRDYDEHARGIYFGVIERF